MTEAVISIQWDDVANLSPNEPFIDDVAGISLPVTNIPQLVERVKHYLKVNNISGYVFASKVLNVTGCFFNFKVNVQLK